VLVAALAVQVAEAQPRGTADIVWQHASGRVHYWAMQGGRRVAGIDIFNLVGGDWTLRGVGDVDGDGDGTAPVVQASGCSLANGLAGFNERDTLLSSTGNFALDQAFNLQGQRLINFFR
jgi:hypothetical protein